MQPSRPNGKLGEPGRSKPPHPARLRTDTSGGLDIREKPPHLQRNHDAHATVLFRGQSQCRQGLQDDLRRARRAQEDPFRSQARHHAPATVAAGVAHSRDEVSYPERLPLEAGSSHRHVASVAGDEGVVYICP